MAADSYRVYARTLNSLIFITQSLRSSEQYDLLLIDSTFIVSFICFVMFILYVDLLIVYVCYRFRVDRSSFVLLFRFNHNKLGSLWSLVTNRVTTLEPVSFYVRMVRLLFSWFLLRSRLNNAATYGFRIKVRFLSGLFFPSS